MTDFDKRLKRAIERGHRASDARARQEAEKALSQQELRGLHTRYRLELSEYIENGLKKLSGHFPGFRSETVVSERGWGAAASRDDVNITSRSERANYYSRMEMVIRPLSQYNVLDLTAKATVRNKEFFNRSHYQRLAEVDIDSFKELIDLWVLEYAEQYARKS